MNKPKATATSAPDSQEKSLAKLKSLIDGIPIASLVTVEADGSLRSRPMATQEIDADAELWFFTRDFSGKVGDALLHPQVCVTYAAPEKQSYVSVSGTAEVVTDPAKLAELWKPSLKAWFPRGLEEPDLALLRIDIVTAEYWEGAGNRLVQTFRVLKALATGESATQSLSTNETLTVRERIGSDTAI